MPELTAQERLQPSLLDRLVDLQPQHKVESPESRVMTKQSLRQAVLRDLQWLFNCEAHGAEFESGRYPHTADSVLNFGLPTLSGQFASTVQASAVENGIKRALLRFEPRILPKTLEVELVAEQSALDTHNRVSLMLRGMLWAQPVPIEFMLRSRIDLEEGRITVEDVSR
jgi:type VI secretion system protein ImpF